MRTLATLALVAALIGCSSQNASGADAVEQPIPCSYLSYYSVPCTGGRQLPLLGGGTGQGTIPAAPPRGEDSKYVDADWLEKNYMNAVGQDAVRSGTSIPNFRLVANGAALRIALGIEPAKVADGIHATLVSLVTNHDQSSSAGPAALLPIYVGDPAAYNKEQPQRDRFPGDVERAREARLVAMLYRLPYDFGDEDTWWIALP
jgi:hypothetical protein